MKYEKHLTDTERSQSITNLKSFIPDVIFDIHAHLYNPVHFPAGEWPFLENTGILGCTSHSDKLSRYMPFRQVHGLFFGLPRKSADRNSLNTWVGNEVLNNSSEISRCLLLVSPVDDPAMVSQRLNTGLFSGIKVYHCYADRPDTMNASITEYAPEWIWEMLQGIQGVLMLHIVRDGGITDANNQQEIKRLCRAYPSVRLILAHIARSFNYRNARRGLHVLADLDNVVVDTSAVCETETFRAALKMLGPRRILWGSDFPVSEMRGRCISTGDGFFWLHPENNDKKGATGSAMTLVGIESLLALQEVSADLGLSRPDVNDIFFNNAFRLLKHHLPEHIIQEHKKDVLQWSQTRSVISGGSGLLSKRAEMFLPSGWPAFFSRCSGAEVWDLNNNRYIDFAGGIGSVLLGYADPDVNAAVQRRINAGNYCTLVNPEETHLAETLLRLHPWAGKVKFARGGGEAMAVAVRIARSSTGKSGIVFCGYHGWHDWYLAANLDDNSSLDGHLLPGLSPKGVPRELVNTAVPFRYNNLRSFEKAVEKLGNNIAAIIMEPVRSEQPEKNFLQQVQNKSRELGSVFIIDEVTSGLRYGFPGACSKLGIHPDIVVYAKAMSNGFPFAAIIGKNNIMDASEAGFISSSYWTDGIGTAAAIAVLEKTIRLNVHDVVWNKGARLMTMLKEMASRFPSCNIEISGMPPSPAITFRLGQLSSVAKAVYISRMLNRGFLVSSVFYMMYAHTEQHIEQMLQSLESVLTELEDLISGGKLKNSMDLESHGGFARLA